MAEHRAYVRPAMTRSEANHLLRYEAARLVQVVRVRGGAERWNVVLPSGKPQTWKVEP